MSGVLVAWTLLVATWAMVLDSWDPRDLLVGGVVAGAVMFALYHMGDHTPSKVPNIFSRMIAFVPLAGAIIRDITVGTWRVTLVVLGVRRLTRPGIIVIPFEERTPVGVAVSSFLITLAPGETLVGIDEERREMLVHVIDASDPDAIRAHFRRFYERHQRRVWP